MCELWGVRCILELIDFLRLSSTGHILRQPSFPAKVGRSSRNCIGNRIAELTPFGVLEDDIVADLARLVWRKQNLMTLRIAERARNRRSQIINENGDSTEYYPMLPTFEVPADPRGTNASWASRLGKTQAAYELITIGEAATLDGLTKELDIKERLDAGIARCLKQLLLVRGVKSVSAAPLSASHKHLPGPSKKACI